MPLGTRFSTVLFAAAGLLLVGGLTPVALQVAGDGSPRDVVAAPARLGGIDAAQARLREVPGDWNTWASLGLAYVEQARVSGDPAYYDKADKALRRSLELAPTNWAAMSGMGALANARHDFRAAVDWGRRAEQVNPSAGSVHGVIADALTQLGDSAGARAAVQRMLDVEPGVAAFTRAAYDFELHGQVEQAAAALRRALEEATNPDDVAFCRYHLGQLAFDNGDPAGALGHFDAGLAAGTRDALLEAGRARAQLALGRPQDALSSYAAAVATLPLPHLVAEYGDALTAAGRTAEAAAQYRVYEAQQRLLAAGGAGDRLADAVYLADHGKPADALTAARAEWASRQPVHVADALAWALHRNGQHVEALRYATVATALGWRNATLLYHRGAIHHALGDRAAARKDLSEALRINPQFDVLQAPVARQLLESLGAAS